MLGALGERSDVGVGGGLVAGDDEQADRVGLGPLRVGGRGPGVGDATAVRRARQVERRTAGLVAEAELAREGREVCASRALLSGPDQDRPLALAQALAERAARAGEAA